MTLKFYFLSIGEHILPLYHLFSTWYHQKYDVYKVVVQV